MHRPRLPGQLDPASVRATVIDLIVYSLIAPDGVEQ